jgi:hypothetical protein
MYTAPTFLSWALAVAPVPPSHTDAPVAYAEPVVEADEYTSPAGHRTRWASATYMLPDGKLAEVFLLADESASGEAIISVDGEAIASSSFDPTIGVTRWTSTEPGASERAAAAMAAIADRGGGDLLDAFVGLDTEQLSGPCSESTKKWVRLAKYAWQGALGGAVAVCCGGTVGAACVACGIFGGIAAGAAEDIANDYCS